MSGLTVTKTNIVPPHIVLFDGDAAIKLGRDGTVTLGPKWDNANDAAAAFLDALTRHIEGWNTRPQPTTSVDAEQVWREALTAFANAGNQAATAIIQAYGNVRADAARREALEEAAKVADGYAAAGKDNPQLAPISAQMRYCAQRIRALKRSQQ